MKRIMLSTLLGFAAFFGAACGTSDENQLPGGGTNNQCSAECSGDNVCAGSSCQAAFPRVYRLTITNITFADRDANGNCWDDPGCGAPDAQIEIKQGNAQVAKLDEDDDDFSLDLNETVDLYFASPMKLEIELYDDDIDTNDLAVACEIDPLNAAIARGGDLSCEGNGNSIEARIDATTVTLMPANP